MPRKTASLEARVRELEAALTTADARSAHVLDVYAALGVPWGADVFAAIEALKHPAPEPELTLGEKAIADVIADFTGDPSALVMKVAGACPTCGYLNTLAPPGAVTDPEPRH